MNEDNPYQTPHLSSQPRRGFGHRHPSVRFRILAAVGAGGVIGPAVSMTAVTLIQRSVGYMDYEFSGLAAMFWGSLGGMVAAIVGAVIGLAKTTVPKSVQLLVALLCGGICSGAIYAIVVLPVATSPRHGVPAEVLFWMGVVPVVSGLINGVVGGLIGIHKS